MRLDTVPLDGMTWLHTGIAQKVNVGGDRFAVSWYTLPMDEALAIAARAEGAPNLEMT